MYGPMKDELSAKIAALKEEGLYKDRKSVV